MRRFVGSAVLMAAVIVAVPSLASFGGNSTPSAPTSNSAPPEGQSSEQNIRDQASKWYGDAYDLIAKAKQELSEGKAKNADKRFHKALDKGQRAVEIDSTYHEAWNLVGYAARQVKDYDRSLAAYEHCLRIQPDYAPAREYLGEAYVELGKPGPAMEQLAWLEKSGATEEAGRLRSAVEAWQKEHPEAVASAPATVVGTSTETPVDSLSNTTK